ncbi:MAG: leucine-rich repeat protein, partial [Solobacterium sp.]|nr:leucine-rich repeat protein [Solobacterium sp.]
MPVNAEGEDIPEATEEPVVEVVEEPSEEEVPEVIEEVIEEQEEENISEEETDPEEETEEGTSEGDSESETDNEIDMPRESEGEITEEEQLAEEITDSPEIAEESITIDTEEEPESNDSNEEVAEADLHASSGITYTISGGTLTISGSGYMEDYHTTDILPEWSQYSSQITRIVVKQGIKYIGMRSFYNLTNVTSVSLPSGLETINAEAFNNCSSLSSINIPNGVDFIGSNAFYGCRSLTSVTIPSSVTIIGSAAFCYCEKLTSVTLPSGLSSIDYGLFFGCTSLNSIVIPYGVKSIAAQAFSSCKGLKTITIPNSVTSIGPNAFIGCSGLTSITIPDSVTSIDDSVFAECTKLVSVTLPKNIISIGKQLFINCTSLRTITIPEKVWRINEYAFLNCSSLSTIRIPVSVTTIDQAAFHGCNNLRTVYYAGSQSQWNRITIGAGNDNLKNATRITIEVQNTIDAINSIGEVTLLKEAAIKNARALYNGLSAAQRPYVTNYQTLVSAENRLSELKINQVIGLIDAIGEVTLESSTAIQTARTAYDKLTSSQQARVTNYSVLVAAEERLFEIPIENVISLIDVIGEVSLDSDDQIGSARNAYNALTEEQKELVTNYQTLLDAEETLSQLQVDHVISMIDSIGEVTLDSEDNITTVRGAYERLTDDQKALITNYSLLENAEAILSELQIQEVITLIDNLPEVITLDDKNAVIAARQAYEALKDNQKQQVTNFDVLESAEAMIEKHETDRAAADAVILMISALPENLVLGDQSVVESVHAAYESLTEDQKALVDNYDVLVQAVLTIEELQVQDVIARINELPETITLEDKNTIEGIRTTYDALTDDQKARITNYETLIAAEETIAAEEEELRWGEILEEDRHLVESSYDIPDGIWVAGIPKAVEYDGTKKTTEFRVYDTNLLVSKSNYSVAYKNNTKAGTATVTLKMKGNYKGTQIINFNITPVDITEEEVVQIDPISAQTTGKTLTPVPVLYWNGKKLKNKTDYTIDYGDWDRKSAGTYEITVNGKGNYTGSRTVTLKVAEKGTEVAVSKLSVTIKGITYKEDMDFNTDILPTLVVKYGKSTVLSRENGDYTVTDIPVIDSIGTYTFRIVGDGTK